MIKHQLHLFFTAIQFYTRIPIPGGIPFREENLSRASRYLPLIGWLVGGVSFVVWLVAAYLTNTSIAIIMSMIASILLTGAFHEDGFADSCDGFGGGWSKEKILLIMKDSRIGTYGAVGLVLILLLKFSLLDWMQVFVSDDFYKLLLLLTSAHSVSRFLPVIVIYTLPYARDTADAKAKPVAEGVEAMTLLIAVFFGILPLFFLALYSNTIAIVGAVLPPGLVTMFMARYFKKWIGGYTGDGLGAIQQVTEICIYLSIGIVWKFI